MVPEDAHSSKSFHRRRAEIGTCSSWRVYQERHIRLCLCFIGARKLAVAVWECQIMWVYIAAFWVFHPVWASRIGYPDVSEQLSTWQCFSFFPSFKGNVSLKWSWKLSPEWQQFISSCCIVFFFFDSVPCGLPDAWSIGIRLMNNLFTESSVTAALWLRRELLQTKCIVKR